MITNSIEGSRSEFLAFFALSRLGYVTPVPRASDVFGVDCFVYLATPEDREFRPEGPAIAVQIKSNDDDIVLSSSTARSAFFQLSTPVFVAVVDKEHGHFRVWETTRRHGFECVTGERDLRLRLRPEPASFANPPDSEKIVYHLGDPIFTCVLSELDGTNSATIQKRLLDSVRQSALKDDASRAFRRLGLPFVLVDLSRARPGDSSARFSLKPFVGPDMVSPALAGLAVVVNGMISYFEATRHDASSNPDRMKPLTADRLEDLVAALKGVEKGLSSVNRGGE